jgi:hypothetical protein
VCELERDSKDITNLVKPYFFIIGVSGCEKNYTTWNNCNLDCWDYSCVEKRNEINLKLRVTVDDQEIILNEAMMLELEFE